MRIKFHTTESIFDHVKEPAWFQEHEEDIYNTLTTSFKTKTYQPEVLCATLLVLPYILRFDRMSTWLPLITQTAEHLATASGNDLADYSAFLRGTCRKFGVKVKVVDASFAEHIDRHTDAEVRTPLIRFYIGWFIARSRTLGKRLYRSTIELMQRLADEENSPILSAQIHQAVAYSHGYRGELEAAETVSQIAIDIYQTLGDDEEIANTSFMLAQNYLFYRREDEVTYSQKIQHYIQQASDYYVKVNNQHQHANIALVYGGFLMETNELEAAEQWLMLAKQEYMNLSDKALPIHHSAVDHCLARTYLTMGATNPSKLDLAWAYGKQALRHIEGTSDSTNQAVIHATIGEIELERNRWLSAQRYLEHGIELAKKIPDSNMRKLLIEDMETNLERILQRVSS